VVAMLDRTARARPPPSASFSACAKPTSGKALLFGLEPTNLLRGSRVGVNAEESGCPRHAQGLRDRGPVPFVLSSPLLVTGAIAMAGLERRPAPWSKSCRAAAAAAPLFRPRRVRQPRRPFLDEPTVGMDVEGRRSFIERIAESPSWGGRCAHDPYLEEADQLPSASSSSIAAGHRRRSSRQRSSPKSRASASASTLRTLDQKDLEGLPVSAVSRDHERAAAHQPAEAVLRSCSGAESTYRS